MGQQHFTYLVITIVIIGIATLVALGAADDSRVQAAKDALQQDIVRALGDAQAYYYSPANMGGGGRTFQNISFNDLSLEPVNPNGNYSLSGSNNKLTLVGDNPSVDVRIQALATIKANGSMDIKWKVGEIPAGNPGNNPGNGAGNNPGNGAGNNPGNGNGNGNSPGGY